MIDILFYTNRCLGQNYEKRGAVKYTWMIVGFILTKDKLKFLSHLGGPRRLVNTTVEKFPVVNY